MSHAGIEYFNRATDVLAQQISGELDTSKQEILTIIADNRTRAIAQMQSLIPRETGRTGSGRRLKKNKHTRRHKKKRGYKK